jgi:transposase
MTASSTALPAVPFGVGFDTSRYGHHVTFLRHDLERACPPFEFPESRAGYDRVLQQFQRLAQRCPTAHFHIRLDVAGQYATNLETVLRSLPYPKTLSVGEPARNARYRQALFPKQKADPVESFCAARFALLEKPKASLETPEAYYQLRELVQRLEGQVRQSTRLNNQLHNLLARVFPELALVAPDLQAGWVLELLRRYPTPAQLARARLDSLTAIAFLSEDKARRLHEQAATSIASLQGDTAATLVQRLVRQLKDSLAEEDGLKGLMGAAYHALPLPNHLDSIPGIGTATAAVLTAKMITIDRFAGPSQVVSYFGVFPEEDSSGIDRAGCRKPGRQTRMSRQGNDLVRKYLWNAALAAMRCNPAVRALYQRLHGRGCRGDIALGHCMRKLLHLVFAVWKTNKPFDPQHYPWEGGQASEGDEKAAGHKVHVDPSRSVVTAANPNIPPQEAENQAASQPRAAGTAAEAGGIDFAALRARVSMEQVLGRLGWLARLTGDVVQRRGPCPIHQPQQSRGRIFSVNLQKNVFRCFHRECGKQGNVLDLWAAVRGVPLYEAAQQLAEAFGIELAAPPGTEKRNP